MAGVAIGSIRSGRRSVRKQFWADFAYSSTGKFGLDQASRARSCASGYRAVVLGSAALILTVDAASIGPADKHPGLAGPGSRPPAPDFSDAVTPVGEHI
jgi:hypothetical protein